MRARTVVATIALAGTVLLGGAAQALADDNDDMSLGNVMGNSGGAFGKHSQGKGEFGSDASGFGKPGGIFDRSTGS
ncbi:hypothetical protein AB0L75_07645 [Streptomyces sp. NPDC052101]|uniref:hypothetical protein n=1 Tax=Streptomyces sp. NPDC052101 TaxID=3155763 RepID=UPI00341C3E62